MDNSELMARLWSKLGEMQNVLETVCLEVGNMQRAEEVQRTRRIEGQQQMDDLAQGLEETWDKVGGVEEQIPQISVNVEALGVNQANFHVRLGAITTEVQRLGMELAQQQAALGLLKNKTREALNLLQEEIMTVKASTRADTEALDTHCQQQFTELCGLLRREIQEELGGRDRRIQALENFCTTTQLARSLNSEEPSTRTRPEELGSTGRPGSTDPGSLQPRDVRPALPRRLALPIGPELQRQQDNEQEPQRQREPSPPAVPP